MSWDLQESDDKHQANQEKMSAVSLLQMGEEQGNKGAETEYAESNHPDFVENGG